MRELAIQVLVDKMAPLVIWLLVTKRRHIFHSNFSILTVNVLQDNSMAYETNCWSISATGHLPVDQSAGSFGLLTQANEGVPAWWSSQGLVQLVVFRDMVSFLLPIILHCDIFSLSVNTVALQSPLWSLLIRPLLMNSMFHVRGTD
jgi:hypothetical protein